MKNPYIQALRDLGLSDYDLRIIRETKSLMQQKQDVIQGAEDIDIVQLPNISYASVYARLSQRGLQGNEASKYTRSLISNVKKNIRSIEKYGYTAYTMDAYKPIANHYGMTIQEFKDLKEGEQVDKLKRAIYDIYGEWEKTYNLQELLKRYNDIVSVT